MKVGKTTLAVQFPRNLLLAVEKGYNAIDNIYAVDVPTWGEFKKYVKQLADKQLMEQFDTITIDTISLLYERCETYVCDREGVDKIGDVPYGAGWKMVDKEFETYVRKLTQIADETGKTAYGLCLIAHAKTRTETDGQTAITSITPDISERCGKIINRMVDVTAYIGQEEGERYIYPRALTIQDKNNITNIYAGSHFANLNDKIELSYEALVNAIAEAMTTDTKGKKVKLSDAPVEVQQEVKVDFKTTKSRVGKIAKLLKATDEDLEEPCHVAAYQKIVESYLGKGKLVRDCTEAQSEHIQGILEELEEYLANNGLAVE